MKNKKKVCPFKKRVKFIPSQRIYQDMFVWCDGENCMAFKDDKCLRLEKSESKEKEGANNEDNEPKE